MNLHHYLNRLRTELDQVKRLRAAWDQLPEPPDAGDQAAVILSYLAQLQHLSGWAMRTAVEQARDADIAWERLARAAQVPLDRLRGQIAAGGPVTVGHATPPEIASHDAGHGRAARPNDRDPLAEVLTALEVQIEDADAALRQAYDDYRQFDLMVNEPDFPQRDRAKAHRDRAGNRQQQAMGARHALEAAYRAVAGRPSPDLETVARLAGRDVVRDFPVGLDRHDAHAEAFLAAHTADPDPGASDPGHAGPRPATPTAGDVAPRPDNNDPGHAARHSEPAPEQDLDL